MQLLLAIDWTNVTGGSILIAVTVATAVIGVTVGIYHASPIGSDAVESWKNLAEGRKAELEESREEARQRLADAERIKAELQAARVALAKCEEQPKTEDLAAAIREMSNGFQTHRTELLSIQNRILGHLEKNQETVGSMQQALIVLVDRNRSQRADESRDPPLST